MALFSKRWQHFTAMALIGDGVMALIHPKRDALAWTTGPEGWKQLMGKLHDRPQLTRAIGVAQIVGGVVWVLQSEKKDRSGALPDVT
jgi:hypothetical protein